MLIFALDSCLKKPGQVDLDKHHEPLLFIAGEKDQICPPGLNKKNFEAYLDKESVTEFKEFPNRGHFIAGQPGWEKVALYVSEFIGKYAPVHQEVRR